MSPSPSNCTSTNNTANICNVSAAVGSSLTLCVNFTHFPDNALRYAEVVLASWKQVSPSEEIIWMCYSLNYCVKRTTLIGYSYTEDWGRCLHVDSVQNSSLFSYVIEVFPPREYPSAISNFVHRKVLFNVQGQRCMGVTQWTHPCVLMH